MDIHVSFPGGKRVDAAFAGHVVRTDQPRDLGGDDSAPAPFDLFLASLATCAGIYVLGFCQARGLPVEGIEVVQHARYEGAKLVGVDLEVTVPPEFPTKYLVAIQRAAELCKVKKALADPPEVHVSVSVTGDAAESAAQLGSWH